MAQLAQQYCETCACEYRNGLFWNGCRVSPSDTPASLGLESGDSLEWLSS